MKEYRGYMPLIRYSAEDECLVGHIAGINDIVGFHGDSVEEMRKAFEEAVDFYLDSCARMGDEPNKPFSGRITLQVTPEMHAELFRKAQKAGAGNFDDWLAKELKESVLHA